jgi:hypothetical protein
LKLDRYSFFEFFAFQNPKPTLSKLNQAKSDVLMPINQPNLKKNDNTSIALGFVPKAVELSDFEDEMENWCCICNEDGTIICKSCDNDVYCTICWNEGHVDPEFKRHIKKLII